MKRFPYYLSVLFLLSLFSSCQKERSFEAGKAAAGSLQSEATGDCLPKTVAGAYVAGKPLTDSNVVSIAVNVTATGPYTIVTDTVNGYYFKGTGTFSATGINSVQLKGTGKPVTEGIDNFTVVFDSSFCLLSVSVLPANAGGPAAFTLQGTNGSCMDASSSGNFVKGVALTSSNSLTVKVNITTIGTYSITTNTANGFSFSGSGAFPSLGVQVVTLAANGTPVGDGVTPFVVTAGTSTCTTNITVVATPPPPPVITSDYFPLTQNSWWSYDDGTGGIDSVKTTVSGTGTFMGKTYQRFISTDGPDSDTSFYRKDAATGFYYNYVDVQELIDSGFGFAQPALDVLFLKETLATGQTWNSDHTATYMGNPFTLRFKFTCINANVSTTVNTHSFTNVYHIRMQPQAGALGTFTDADDPTDFYYAKGIGLIKIDDGMDEQDIRYWKVN